MQVVENIIDQVCAQFATMRAKNVRLLITAKDGVAIHLYDKWITNHDIEAIHPHSDPMVVVGIHSVTLLSSKTIYTFPMIVDYEVRRGIVSAGVAFYEGIMQTQMEQKKEITGLVIQDTKTSTVKLVTCVTSQNWEYASKPYCGAHRHCASKENPAEHVVLGEFHTHPASTGSTITPPSDADMYQLLLAACQGQHNLACVFAPEGLYICLCTLKSIELFNDEIYRYFKLQVPPNIQMSAWNECKQPTKENIDCETYPYLHCLFNEPQLWFRQLGTEPPLSAIKQYINRVQQGLHITIFLIPPHHPTL